MAKSKNTRTSRNLTSVIKFAHSVVNLVKQGVTRNQQDLSKHIILDGQNNEFPKYLMEIVSLSPVASACMEKVKTFVRGGGFVNEELSKVQTSAAHTLIDLHNKIASDFAFYHRFAIKVIPKRGGGIDRIEHIPAEWVRWGSPDPETQDVSYVYCNPFILTGEEYQHDKSAYYPLYTLDMDDRKIREDIAKWESDKEYNGYKGHIYFYNRTNQRNRNYSRPSYFAAEDYIKTDSKLGLFHDRNTDNNFFLGGILSVFGDPNEGVVVNDDTGEVYETRGEQFEKSLSDTFGGASEAGSIMVNWIRDKEQIPDLKPWNGNTQHEMFIMLQNEIKELLSIAFMVPKVLLGIPTAGRLGATNEVREAIKFLNENTKEMRRELEKTYAHFLEQMKVSMDDSGAMIQPVKDFTDLPDTIFNALTANQKAEYLEAEYGIKPDENAPEEIEQPDPEIDELLQQINGN